MKNEFQYRLQKLLAASGMTAKELSEKTGISEANISNYINGKYVAKQDKCYLLAVALGADPGWLMTGDEPIKAPKIDLHLFGQAPNIPHTKEAMIIASAIDRMPADRREQALKILQIAFADYADLFKED